MSAVATHDLDRALHPIARLAPQTGDLGRVCPSPDTLNARPSGRAGVSSASGGRLRLRARDVVRGPAPRAICDHGDLSTVIETTRVPVRRPADELVASDLDSRGQASPVGRIFHARTAHLLAVRAPD